MVVVNAFGFAQTLTNHRLLESLTSEYGVVFHRCVTGCTSPNWPSDVYVPFSDFGEIVSCMAHDLQMPIGFDALRSMVGNAKQKEALREEILNGKATILLDNMGEVSRIVSVVALRCRRDDGHILVQVGKSSGGVLQTQWVLPGSKQRMGELPRDAAARIRNTKLPDIGAVSNGSFEREVVWKESAKYGVRTKYLRTTQSVEVSLSAVSSRTAHNLLSRQVVGGVQQLEGTDFHISQEADGNVTIFAWVPEEDFKQHTYPDLADKLREWLLKMPMLDRVLTESLQVHEEL